MTVLNLSKRLGFKNTDEMAKSTGVSKSALRTDRAKIQAILKKNDCDVDGLLKVFDDIQDFENLKKSIRSAGLGTCRRCDRCEKKYLCKYEKMKMIYTVRSVLIKKDKKNPLPKSLLAKSGLSNFEYLVKKYGLTVPSPKSFFPVFVFTVSFRLCSLYFAVYPSLV